MPLCSPHAGAVVRSGDPASQPVSQRGVGREPPGGSKPARAEESRSSAHPCDAPGHEYQPSRRGLAGPYAAKRKQTRWIAQGKVTQGGGGQRSCPPPCPFGVPPVLSLPSRPHHTAALPGHPVS